MKEQNAKQNKEKKEAKNTCTHHAALAYYTQHSDTEPPIPLESVPIHILNEANVIFFYYCTR